MNDNYNTTEDFTGDESFVSWVFKANEKNKTDWDTWLSNNPEKIKMANEAASILKLIRIKDICVPNQQLTNAEERLRSKLEASHTQAKILTLTKRKIWYAVAAILIVVLSFGLSIIFDFDKNFQVATNNQKTEKSFLPDGTEVTQKDNAQLTFSKQWKTGTDREVWLKGEAFFHVKKTLVLDKFVVHTYAFDVEVTGTSFNVINLDGKSSILLKEGSVKIHRPDESEILMKPGDFVEFSNVQIPKKIFLEKADLNKIINTLEFYYGVHVVLKNQPRNEIAFTGKFYGQSLNDVLEVISFTNKFKYNQTGNTVSIFFQ